MTTPAIASADLARRYDDSPYESGALEQTHPSRLATLASLFGMRPAPPGRCRVLELGCGDGSNLIPMAWELPGATFVGVDISGRAIGKGQEEVRALGLTNISLREADLLALDPDAPDALAALVGPDGKSPLGAFDYVITHGVYAWVPRAVQQRILALSKRCLAPQGVAYVSYNAYPGGYFRDMVRAMATYHTREHDEADRVPQARALLGFLGKHAAPDRKLYRAVLESERERLDKIPEQHLVHDDFGPVYQPLFFHQFMADARPFGLQFLAEACYADMQDEIYPPEVREFLRSAGDREAYEQYLDMLSGCSFRQTLLCHDDVKVEIGVTPDRLLPLLARAIFRPASARPDLRSDAVEEFRALRTPNRIGTGEPFFKAALLCLSEAAPRALSPAELARAAAARLGAAEPEDAALQIANLLLVCYTGRLVEVHATPPPLSVTPGERPLCSPVARYQASRGDKVTTLLHQNMLVPEAPRRLMQLLDGTRDRAALAEALPPDLAAQVEALLRGLGESALLCA